MNQERTVSAIIRGRVQGVFYRAWTKESAEGLGLSGTVRNRADGGVEAVFSGHAEAVEEMLVLCRQGPPGAQVDDIAIVEEISAPSSPDGFVVLRS